MQENSDKQIVLFVRDETTGRRAFNAKTLKAEARDRSYPLNGLEEPFPNLAI
jgi:hypothetical protein